MLSMNAEGCSTSNSRKLAIASDHRSRCLFSVTEMKKIDVKRELKDLYRAPVGDFILLDVPPLRYFMVDGHGDPNTEPSYRAAVEALYAASYTLKFSSKNNLNKDYVVPPLEGLWWAENPEDFISRKKDRWSWTMMIMVPAFIDKNAAEAAISAARAKRNNPAFGLIRLSSLEEARVVQTLHIGSYDAEGPILKRMHEEFIPSRALALSGIHHEIYLSDPRRVASDKLRTILRQPVRPSK
ncbi:GyrI-like domain-containing protein [Mesorhizobium koreense]|uniref:GyrI-like domain-containing protein n=1 Tax=Mesorhizobium koreense TaxID=3074855 RepID=UPI00287BB185|nr:GyrI-like domain-containing protein [Mesorhizobium sp. WR6]